MRSHVLQLADRYRHCRPLRCCPYSTTLSPAAAIVPLWAAWAAGWLLAAGWSARTVSRPPGPSGVLHMALIAAAAVLLFPRHDGSRLLGHPLFPPSAWAAWLGLVLVVLGLSFAVWARIHLG